MNGPGRVRGAKNRAAIDKQQMTYMANEEVDNETDVSKFAVMRLQQNYKT